MVHRGGCAQANIDRERRRLMKGLLMRHPISRRIAATAVLALAAWGSAPLALRAAPASGFGVFASQDADFIAPVRLWLSTIWPWNGSAASRNAVRHSPALAKPLNACGMDPSGQPCTKVVTPQNGCGMDPNGQQCTKAVKPQNACGGDLNRQRCLQS
jgi:hypothetical protein